MAEKKLPSFDDFIQEGRQRKRNQELAQKLLGSGRRSSAPAPLNRKKATGGGSLASRAGVSKSTAGTPRPSFGNRVTNGTHQNQASGGSRRLSGPHLDKQSRIVQNALNGFGDSAFETQANIRGLSNGSRGISIRGMGGTFSIIAQNFAPGTTAADIEAVLAPEEEDPGLISCKLISSKPTVIAELVFSNKKAADWVISTFNNQKADGRLLHVWMKNPAPQFQRAWNAPPGSSYTVQSASQDLADMEIDEDAELERQQRQRQREEAHAKRAQPAYYDGRYGFSDASERYHKDDRSYRDYQDDREGNRKDPRSRSDDSRDRGYDRDYDMEHDRPETERRGRGSRAGGLVSDEILSYRSGRGRW